MTIVFVGQSWAITRVLNIMAKAGQPDNIIKDTGILVTHYHKY